ncbi:hypothetical protein GF367_04460 [Candidatus Woesearchaeota archaeon]|nr:hypothetical protein [Candidatus Woesearchaeota archaeon]
MKNINITIPDDVHRELKIAAATKGKPLKHVVIETLEAFLKTRGERA